MASNTYLAYTTGNVGIGTTGPSSLLHIQGAGSVAAPGTAFLTLTNTHGTANDQFGINFTNTGYAGTARINSLLISGGTEADLHFYTGGSTPTDQMVIKSTGNVGIGLTNPATKLQIGGGSGSALRISYNSDSYGSGWYYGELSHKGDASGGFYIDAVSLGDSGSAGIVFRRSINAGSSFTESMRITKDGNVGIGTTSPTHLIHLKGGAYCDGTGDWIAGSDRAYKKDIDYNFEYGLEAVKQLKPVYYVHKQDKASKRQIGFIAQDVKKVIPELVSGEEGSLGLSYGQLTAVLVNAVKDLQKEMEGLKHAVERKYSYLPQLSPNELKVYSADVAREGFFGTKSRPLGKEGLFLGLFQHRAIPFNVGIGTASPSYKLQLSTDSAGKPSTNTWTIVSDRRVKKDIRPYTNGLSIVKRINPVWFKYNGKGGFPDDNQEHIGVIGQEIVKVAPYTVNTFWAKLNPTDKKETELLNFNSHALTFDLINAVKELDNNITKLTQENQELKKSNKELKSELENMKTRLSRLEARVR